MTEDDRWTAVDKYLTEMLVKPDAALNEALSASVAAGLPPISVSAPQGKLLHLIARLMGARNILEIGTLGGYSTIWLARALPTDGRLITLEYEPKHAEVARKNIARAGLSGQVELIVGKAIDTLPKLHEQNRGPFDLIFIDADKVSTKAYFEWSMRLARPGSAIIVDNVIRKGAVVDPQTADESVRAIRDFNKTLSGDKRVSATAIQTVGSKGYDGLAIIMVL